LQALIVLLVIVWVFLLGVLVGRSRPEEKRLAGWLEKAVGWAQPRPAVLNPDAPIQTPPGLGLTPAEPAPAPPGGAPDPAAPASNEPEGLTKAPEPDPAVTESAPADLAGPADEALTAEPEPLFAVQTALASDATEARQRVAQLASQGFQAYFYQNGPRFYVRVGPFTTRSEAADNLRRLEELGYKSPYISKLR
jgi:cell division protein FtsN